MRHQAAVSGRLSRSSLCHLTSASVWEVVVYGAPHLSRLSRARRVSFTDWFTGCGFQCGSGDQVLGHRFGDQARNIDSLTGGPALPAFIERMLLRRLFIPLPLGNWLALAWFRCHGRIVMRLLISG
jgi:hypothetical protein